MTAPARPKALPWEELKSRLDENQPFNMMRGTPYYRDAVYEQFSASEYARRYAAIRAKMRAEQLDCVIVPGGPSHWSFGGGMLWLTGHWEWHALCCYVVVPLEGEPTLIYSMGGTHAEAVRRDHVRGALRRARQPRRTLCRRDGRAHLRAEARARAHRPARDRPAPQGLPAGQPVQRACAKACPSAELVFTRGWMHELLSIHSAEELDCIRRAGRLCEDAMNAMVARARPGVTEYQLRAAAGAAILEGGGDIDFLIIGSTAMDDPALVFGNPRPSGRVLQQGDIINMELAAGYRGYTAQVGSPICIGQPTDMVKRFWDEITLPGFEKMAAAIRPGNPLEAIREAGKFFRQKGVQSRPIHAHGIDLITDGPHVFCDHVDAEPFEQVFRPGMVFMAEPNPITADGQFGIFLGHTFIVTATGNECVDEFPLGAGGRRMNGCIRCRQAGSARN